MAGTSQKIKLEGANQYKSDLDKITKQSKILAQEMKQVASSFDSTTTAEEKYQKSAAKLTELYKIQEQKVKEIEKNLEESAKQYGENSKKVDDWKEKLAKAQTELNETKKALNDNEKELEEHKNSVKANAEAQAKFNEEQKKLKNAEVWKKIGDSAKVCAAAVAAVAAAAAAAAKAMWDLTKAQGEWADALLTTSKQTDISTDTLQKWEYAARFIDTDVESMQKALAKIAAQQKTAVKSGRDYIQVLDGQRISLKKANGESKTAEELFYDELEALGKIADEATQNAAAQELFGKSFQEMKPLIDAGPGALKEFGDEAERLGLILSKEDVTALGEFDDKMQKFEAQLDVSAKRLALTFLPLTQKVADGLVDLSGSLTAALSDGFQMEDAKTIAEKLIEYIGNALKDVETMLPYVTEFVVQLFQLLMNVVTQELPVLVECALQIIMGLINGLAQCLPTLIPAIVDMVNTIVETIISNVDLLVDAAVALVEALATGIIDALPVLIEKAPEIIMQLLDALYRNAPVLMKAGIVLIGKLIEGIITMFGSLLTSGGDIVQKIGEGIRNIIPNALEWGRDLVQNFIDGIKSMATSLWNTVTDVWGRIKDFIGFSEPKEGPLSDFHTYAPDMMKLFAQGIKDNQWRVDDAVKSAFNLQPTISASVGSASAGRTLNYGGVSINVYGAAGQDVNVLADIVMDKMQRAVNRKEAIYA